MHKLICIVPFEHTHVGAVDWVTGFDFGCIIMSPPHPLFSARDQSQGANIGAAFSLSGAICVHLAAGLLTQL